jgi:hypothetical protein
MNYRLKSSQTELLGKMGSSSADFWKSAGEGDGGELCALEVMLPGA